MSKKRTFFGVLTLATALLLLVTSCRSKKLVSPLSHASSYEWMNAKMSMEVSADSSLNSPSSYTLSGSLRMRRDSTVWISTSMWGVEGVRALVTQDSVIMVNRMNETYLAEPIALVSKAFRFPITLQEFQSLLLGDGTSDHVEIQFGPYTAKIRYSDIQWDEPVTFPIKINKKYERIKL